jgi:hypothetical protein
LSQQEQDERSKKLPFEDEALIINGKIEDLHSRREEYLQKNDEYQQRQLLFNRWLTLTTVGLLFTSLFANAISWYATLITKQAVLSGDKASTNTLAQMKVQSDAMQKAAKTAEDTLTENKIQFANTLAEIKRQSRAMQDAAEAATKSSRVAEKALEISQRANLFFTQPSPLSFEYGKTPEITLSISNTGPIPATVFEKSSGYFIGLDSELPTPDNFRTETSREEIRIPPAGSRSRGMRRTFKLTTFNETIPHPKTVIEYIQSGKASFWFYITCRYRDYFGTHRTCTLFKYELGQLVVDSSAIGYACAD